MNNRGTPMELLGQRVLVYPNGITWRNPDTMKTVLLGRSRLDSVEELERLLKVKPARRPTPVEFRATAAATGVESPEAVLYRAHWRAYYYASSRAKRSGVAIMSKGEFETLMKRANGACELTHIPFSVERPKKGAKALWAPSVDRVSCRGSYERSNCRLVCVAVNIALNEFGKDTMLTIAKALMSAEEKRALKRASRVTKDEPETSQ